MRSFLQWTAPVGALFAVAIVTDCGGSTTSTGGSDASTDSSSSSSSGSSGGSSGGSSSSGSSGGSTSSSGGSSSSGSGSGGNCPTCTEPGMICCNGVDCSVDSQNDPDHCGACNVVCSGSTPFCQQGKCTVTPCESGDGGGPGCCGPQNTCATGEVCCEFEGPQDYVGCYAWDGGGPRCPPGCPACVSDRNVKRDIEPVDPQAVLDGLSRVPVATWSYKSDDPSVRHMGPMAQDFYGEFGLGNTDRAYSPIDAHGVAFAAIQALYERVQKQEARIQELERQNAALSAGKSRPAGKSR